MHQIRFGAVQAGELLLKISGVKVQVPRGGDMPGGKFLGRPDIEHDRALFLTEQLLAARGIHMLDGGRGGFVRGDRRCRRGAGEQAQSEQGPMERAVDVHGVTLLMHREGSVQCGTGVAPARRHQPGGDKLSPPRPARVRAAGLLTGERSHHPTRPVSRAGSD